MKITEEPSITYKIRNLPEGGWADITLREWDKGGTFMCMSDFGEFKYSWGAIGAGTLREFLCGLDKQYFMKKTRPQDYMVFDLEETCKEMRQDLLRLRRSKELFKDIAREAWEAINHVEMHSFGKTEFHYMFQDSEAFAALYEGDPSSVPQRERYNAHCDILWERVWPHITKYWREQADVPQRKTITVTNVDIALLREQRNHLLTLPASDETQGITNLLDDMLDVAEGFKP